MDPLKPAQTATVPVQPTQPQAQKPQLTPTVEDLLKVCPDSGSQNLAKYFPFLAKGMVAHGLTSKNQLIAMVAMVYTETRGFNPIPEEGKGGGKYGQYYGRGFVQLTHQENYAAAGKTFKVDLLGDPDKALDPELAGQIAGWFWKGGSGGADITPYAEKGDWANCRSILNAGSPGRIGICWGREVYFPAIQRAIATFKSGLDPNAVGGATLPGDYGLGCLDPGSGSVRTLTGLNPTSQESALEYALGIHQLDNQRALMLRAELDVASQPDILKLDAQLTFTANGLGKDLDDTYTVDEITFYFGGTLTADLVAYKPDPNAPPVQAWLHDANTTTSGGSQPTGPAPAAGDIPGKIYAAAIANKGKDTSDGPEGGNKACAFAVNKFCIIPAGLKMLGAPDSPWGVPVAVLACEAALNGGRGQAITRANAVPGDIWIAHNSGHIGICSSAGCATVLSNGSSKHCFAWEGPIDSVNSGYGGPEKLFRVLN